MNARQLAPWTIRPRQLAPDLQTTCPQFKNTYVMLDKYILCSQVLPVNFLKDVCFLKYITRLRLTFVAFDCNDRINT